jgi:uncharacterized protein (DUF305 family)
MATLVLLPAGNPSGAAAQVATPAVTYSCEAVPTASPVAGMHGMAMGTPTAAMDYAAVALDQAYIDMMIPHHQSIIPVAEAALPRLTDERLREIAQAVVAAQQPEIEELRGYREQWYGSAEPMPMDEAMMAAMVELLPGMSGTMEEMAFQMDAPAQVAAFCAAENPDLAFIDQTIPHHQMAIEASEVALEQATHPEVRDFAQRVIDAQQREIETLTEIRSEIAVSATPSSS